MPPRPASSVPPFPPSVLPCRPPQHEAPGAAAAPPAGEGRAGPGRGSLWAQVRGGPGRASRSVPSDVSPRGGGRPSPGSGPLFPGHGQRPAGRVRPGSYGPVRACWAAGQGEQRPAREQAGSPRERGKLCVGGGRKL